MQFLRDQHLRSASDFHFVRSAAIRKDCGFFLLLLRIKNEPDQQIKRLGVVASKRVGNAVVRNRAKRRLRSLFRLHQKNLPDGANVILIARSSIGRAPFETLEKRFLGALKSLPEEMK
jgi:ribonuclease P protein component